MFQLPPTKKKKEKELSTKNDFSLKRKIQWFTDKDKFKMPREMPDVLTKAQLYRCVKAILEGLWEKQN